MSTDSDKPGTFPLEKILTVSATEWIETADVHLVSYNMVGVHVETEDRNLHEYFASKVPKNAEIVVEYRTSVSIARSTEGTYKIQIASGTALVPKR